MSAQRPSFRRSCSGFNLFHNLVFVVIIGIITLAAVPMIKRTTAEASEVKAKRNAQTICSLYNGARTMGVVFSAPSKAGIVNQLMDGGTSSSRGGDAFRMTRLSGTDLVAALRHCHYDPVNDDLTYNPAGGEPLEVTVVQVVGEIDQPPVLAAERKIIPRSRPWKRLAMWFTTGQEQSQRVVEYIQKNPGVSQLGIKFGEHEWRSSQGDDGLWWPEYRTR